MQKTILVLLTLLLSTIGSAQRNMENAADLLQEIKKLNVLSNVLYVAAHPDDENTRLIAWLENEKRCRTAYLSLTRGDGGQNLIGSEKGDAMGVLRTQELLEARKIDGAEQFFSRAKDFGYSKTAKETLEIWDKTGVLADLVWTIRKFKPDVIITRFPPDKRGGHGHHTASAMLAEIAFSKAADKSSYPEQLEFVEPWQAKRILWNTSVWWDKQLPEKAAKEQDYIKIDIGAYNPTLGLSYSEIAADSRSQHKSQGFGSSRSRGTKLEYLKHTQGEQAKSDLFEGIDMSWNRIEGTAAIQAQIDQIVKAYDPSDPSKSVSALTNLYASLEGLADNFYKSEKLRSTAEIIQAAAGIHVEMIAEQYNYPAFHQSDLKGTATFISRSQVPVSLKNFNADESGNFESRDLLPNENLEIPFSHAIALNPSHPYWLVEYDSEMAQKMNLKFDESVSQEDQKKLVRSLGTDNPILRDHEQHGLPENRPVFVFKYTLEINGVSIPYEQKVDYKWTDRVDGELHRDVIFSPELTANPAEKVYIFTGKESQAIDVLVGANADSMSSNISLIAPKGWSVKPKSIPLELKKDQQVSVQFQLTAPSKPSQGEISFQFESSRAQSVQKIDYPHIQPQVLFPIASAKVVRVELEKTKTKIGYIEGSGDEVAENLRQVGFEVSSFKAEDLPVTDLSQFETVLVGIRAYNTEESLKNGNAILNEFVKSGGNVIVQYNTNRGLKSEEIGPYDFQISRNRVTEEHAKVNFIHPDEPALNRPNKLDKNDFDGWVQERGLYFADEWDEKFSPVLSWNDPGEEPQEGGLIIAPYGKGHFMYTGISFFRQLPAGVPGAYRLLSNLISYGE